MKLPTGLTGITAEKTFKTHDIAIPIRAGGEQGNDVRMLLLSAADMQSPENGWKRIEKLYHLYGGHNVGIVFLVGGKEATEGGVHDYMELQAKYDTERDRSTDS